MKILNLIYISLFTVFALGCSAQQHTNTATNENLTADASSMLLNVQKTEYEFDGLTAPSFALLEMFTSEGCSSCPAAYPIAKKMVDRYHSENSKVLLLDYHVDYWNRKGWVDPFSKPQFSARQQIYADKFKGVGLYTPQMVVNGSSEFVASDEVKEQLNIQKALKIDRSLHLKLDVATTNGDSLPLTYKVSDVPANCQIIVTLVEHNAKTHVKGGENTGKELVHYNIVREFTSKPLMKTATVNVPKTHIDDLSNFALIVFVQNTETMEVLAANSYELKP